MDFNQIFMYMVAFGAVLGGVDFLLGNRLGFGQKFKDGFDCIASMGINMTGIIVIAPVLAKLMQPVVFPVCSLIGIDPSIIGALFSTNLGGYSLAEGLAVDHTMALYFGLIISSMLGATITYIMPLGFGLIEKEDKEFFIKGLSLGMIPIPVGGFVGGLMMGLPSSVVLQNLIPICIIDVFLILGLLKFPDAMVRVFSAFAELIRIIAIVGLIVGGVEYFVNMDLVKGTKPIQEAIWIPCSIALMLMGCLPLMELVFRLFRSIFEAFGRKVGINAVSVGGILLSFATGIAVLKMIRDMNPKGKVVTTAFLVCGMAMFTSFLAYTMGIDPEICTPQILAKLTSGAVALVIACMIPEKSGFFKLY